MDQEIHITITDDGSPTLFHSGTGEHYHSVFGAVTESAHVFINAGLKYCLKKEISILEVGFGTGLNALLTLIEAEKSARTVFYHSIELYPLDQKYAEALDYNSFTGKKYAGLIKDIHNVPWETEIKITNYFSLKKIYADASKINLIDLYDVTYFDAFSPEKQPELWTDEMFLKIFNHLNIGGILTTYCSKGTVKRALRNAGFQVFILPGPHGKRHIIRAVKK